MKNINVDNMISGKTLNKIRIVFAVIILYYVVMRVTYPWNEQVHPLLYFTIQSNIICALFWILSSFIKKSFLRTVLSLAAATYMTITGVVFIVFLDAGFTEEIYTRLANKKIDEYVHYYSMICSIITHYIMPFLAIVDFIIFTNTKKLKRRHILFVLIYPFSYAVFHVIYSIATDTFIYPFMDPEFMGHWIFALLCALLVGVIIVTTSRVLIRINRRTRQRIDNYYMI